MSWPKVSEEPEVQALYEQMRDAGESHNIAEMCAMRETPASRTDREFWRGRWNQFESDPRAGRRYQAIADSMGMSTVGKQYIGQLARYPGDPQAWVDGRGDIKKVCEANGWGCSGQVDVKVSERPPRPDVDIADDIVEEKVAEAIKQDPDLASKDRNALKEEVKEKIRPHWTK